MRLIPCVASLAALLGGVAGCERQADSKIASLPEWLSQRPGSDANPIGAVALWSRCPNTKEVFVLGLSQIVPHLASINAAFPAPSPNADYREREAGYPAVVAPLTQLYGTISGNAFAPAPTKGVYESTADYDARVAAWRAEKNAALDARLKNQTYAIILGKFRIEGMEEASPFSPSWPDAVAYDANSKILTPVRDDSFRWPQPDIKPLGRIETIVFGQMDPATLRITETRWDSTRVVIENEKEVPLGPLPPMAVADIQKRHPGLAFVVVGRFASITPRKYNSIEPWDSGSKTRKEYVDQELHMRVDRIELKDICSNEVLWNQDVK